MFARRCGLLPAFLSLGLVHAQFPLATKAGLIYLAEGEVLVDGTALTYPLSRMIRIAENHMVATKAGRAELLLQLHNYLRLDEDGTVEMRSDEFSNVRVQVKGAAILDVGALDKNAITVNCGRADVTILKPGIFRFNCGRREDPDVLLVYRGRANVTIGTVHNRVESRRLLTLQAGAKARKFDGTPQDSFDRWSAERAARIARMDPRTPILPELNLGLDDARIIRDR